MGEATESALAPAESAHGLTLVHLGTRGMNLRQLIAELRGRGVSPYVLSDVAPLGASIMTPRSGHSGLCPGSQPDSR